MLRLSFSAVLHWLILLSFPAAQKDLQPNQVKFKYNISVAEHENLNIVKLNSFRVALTEEGGIQKGTKHIYRSN